MTIYAILRIQKHTSIASIKRSGKHKNREQDTPNADPLLTPENRTEGAKTSNELVEAVKKMVDLATVKAKDKPVIAVEYLITASPEFFKESSAEKIIRYFEDAKKWLRKKNGFENVISITQHNDEKSPHLSCFVVPLVEVKASTRKRSVIIGRDSEGKPVRETRTFETKASINLSAKRFFGGSEALSELQTDFFEAVGREYGLERGIKGSKATHQRVKTFYANIKQGESKSLKISTERTVLKKGIFSRLEESDAAFAQRVANSVKQQLEPARDIALLASQEARRRKKAEKTAYSFEIAQSHS